ncbi:EKA-like protein [Blumeria hordei DH14]|uniref:EKA-like protein n=1 Tax=Blumeria graminis f. sp. hordei (strain DH14) TaxID=546991 RepID=N1J7M1_BLUG1|nr:EKA-like protein [Blumeria hordei DH14]
MDRMNTKLKNYLERKRIPLSSIDGQKMELDIAERMRAFEEDSNSTNPEVEMGDATISQYIKEGLESSRWNIQKPEDGQASEAPVNINTGKIAVPAMKRTSNVDAKKADGAASTTAPHNTIPRTSGNNHTSCSDSNSKNTATCPPELRAILEAEEQRAAQTTTNLTLCTAAINGVENALSPLSKGSSVQLKDSMKLYLRAAIAQFMMSGPGTVLPNLPPRPNCQNHGGKIVEQTIEK